MRTRIDTSKRTPNIQQQTFKGTKNCVTKLHKYSESRSLAEKSGYTKDLVGCRVFRSPQTNCKCGVCTLGRQTLPMPLLPR